MEPINFLGANVIFAENQEEYKQLPAHKKEGGEVTHCWKLSEKELEVIKDTGKLYITQLTFNNPLQPIRAGVSHFPPIKHIEYLKQNRPHEDRGGNPWAAGIACLIGSRDAESVLQIDLIDDDKKLSILDDWLKSKGWERFRQKGLDMPDTEEFYLIYGYREVDGEEKTAMIVQGNSVVWSVDKEDRLVQRPSFVEAYRPLQRKSIDFGAFDEKTGGAESGVQYFSHASCHHAPEIYSGIGEARSSELLKQFFAAKR